MRNAKSALEKVKTLVGERESTGRRRRRARKIVEVHGGGEEMSGFSQPQVQRSAKMFFLFLRRAEIMWIIQNANEWKE